LLSEVSLPHATWLKKFYYKKKKHIIKCVCDQIWSRVFNFEKGEKLKILKSEEFVTINFNNKFVTDKKKTVTKFGHKLICQIFW
jgi:hypothetical protein